MHASARIRTPSGLMSLSAIHRVTETSDQPANTLTTQVHGADGGVHFERLCKVTALIGTDFIVYDAPSERAKTVDVQTHSPLSFTVWMVEFTLNASAR